LDIIIAIVVGVAGGVIGVIPFLVARSRMKARMKKDGVGGVMIGIAATFISFIVMIIEIVLCYLLAKDYLLPFAVSAIAVFLLAMIVYTATLMKK